MAPNFASEGCVIRSTPGDEAVDFEIEECGVSGKIKVKVPDVY